VFSPPLWNCFYASVACAASLSKLTASRWLERLQAASLVMVPETYFSPASSGYQTNLHEIINFLMFSTAIRATEAGQNFAKIELSFIQTMYTTPSCFLPFIFLPSIAFSTKSIY
jgi:hypothetical protein